MILPPIRSTLACALVSLCMLAPACALADPAAGARGNAAAGPAATPQLGEADAADVQDIGTAQTLSVDNPVTIRNTLAKQPAQTGSPTLRERVGKLLTLPGHTPPRDPNLANVGLDRELVFMVPVPYGVLYESKTHELTVDADLSGDDMPGTILLRKTVKGPSGRDLVIAPEARAKGYIQHIDLIELKANGHGKTLIHGRYAVPQAVFAKTHGDFAVELRCMLVAPYLKDQHEHSDPTDENPTDVTTRTSTLYADVQAIWLVSTQTGTVLTKKLRLSN